MNLPWSPCLLALLLAGVAGRAFAVPVDAAEAPPRVGALYGTLLERGRPVPHAIVSFPGLWLEAQTELDGTFRLTGIPEGRRVLRVRRFKRPDFSVKVNVVPGREDTIVVNVPLPYVEPRPCPLPTPECTERDGRQQRRIGQHCEVHPDVILAADTVRILHDAKTLPGQKEVQRDSFPNALTWWYMPRATKMGRPVGGVGYGSGRDADGRRGSAWPIGRAPVGGGPWWIEVACCSECRAALARFVRRTDSGASMRRTPADGDARK